jgi:hypothetical protein
VQGLRADDPRIKSIKALPRNTEKFRTMQINSYVFLDSLSFLDGSLEAVTSDLVSSGHTFPLMDKSGLYSCASQKELLLRKGVYRELFATFFFFPIAILRTK